MSARRRTKDSSGGGFVALLILGAIAWLIMFIVRHIWVILGILVVVGSIYLAKAIAAENRRRRDAYARYCAGVAAEADQQDGWVAAGDERGVFGPGAVELMRYIRSGGSTPPATAAAASTVVVPEPVSPARQAAVPAVVAGGVGIALLLAQVPGPGSEPSPGPATPTRTTSPFASSTALPTPTRTVEPVPTYVAPTTASAPPTYAAPTSTYVPPPPTSTYVAPPPTAQPAPVYQPAPQSAYYRNCSQAHADGRYNIPQGDPAYRPGLDRDRDGFACE